MCFVGVAWGFVVRVKVCCGVMLVVIGTEALPRRFGLWGNDLFAVPCGFPFALCSVGDLLHEIRELACF